MPQLRWQPLLRSRCLPLLPAPCLPLVAAAALLCSVGPRRLRPRFCILRPPPMSTHLSCPLTPRRASAVGSWSHAPRGRAALAVSMGAQAGRLLFCLIAPTPEGAVALSSSCASRLRRHVVPSSTLSGCFALCCSLSLKASFCSCLPSRPPTRDVWSLLSVPLYIGARRFSSPISLFHFSSPFAPFAGPL